MRRIVLWMLLFACLTSEAQLSYTWNDRTQSIYESITSLRIPEAKKWIVADKKNNPNNLSYPLLESYADFYQLFLNENTQEYNQLYPNFKSRIELLEKGPQNSPYYLYSLGYLMRNMADYSYYSAN
jgi:hypothetical protein